jgi:DNA-binding PadR family transcriptional regulator
MRKNDDHLTLLTSLQLGILSALAARPLYAGAIAQQVSVDSEGVITVTRATMHHQLKLLLSKNLIQIDPFAYPANRSQGKIYSLTPCGAQEFERGIKRQQSAVYVAKLNLQRYHARTRI